MIQEDKDDVIPYCVATGDVKKLVTFFLSRGQLQEGLLAAQVQVCAPTGAHAGGWVWGAGRRPYWLSPLDVMDRVRGGSASACLPSLHPSLCSGCTGRIVDPKNTGMCERRTAECRLTLHTLAQLCL